METRDMVRMANQIGMFFKGYGEDEARKEIANHINSFWEPRMRKILFAYLDAGGKELDPLVAAACTSVKRPKDAA